MRCWSHLPRLVAASLGTAGLLLRAELARWSRLIKDANIQMS